MNIKFKSWLLIVSTLVLGLFLGSLFTRMIYRTPHGGSRCHHFGGHMGHGGEMMGNRHGKEFILRKMEKRLDLTENQKKSIDPVLERYSTQFQEMITQSRTAFKSAMDEMHGELKPLLSKEQNEKLEKMRRRMEKRHHWKKDRWHE